MFDYMTKADGTFVSVEEWGDHGVQIEISGLSYINVDLTPGDAQAIGEALIETAKRARGEVTPVDD